MVVSSSAVFGMSIMQTFQESTAQESSRVGAGGGGQAIIFREQGMTFGYISMTKKTLRIIHVLVGRINYLTGRISECHKLLYRAFMIGLISTTLSSLAYVPPREEHGLLS